MPAYLLVEIDVREPETYERYKSLVPPSIAAYGGKYLARGGKTEVLEGDWAPKRLVLLEFDSAERAKAWWASTEYEEAKALRQQCASTRLIVLEGLTTPL